MLVRSQHPLVRLRVEPVRVLVVAGLFVLGEHSVERRVELRALGVDALVRLLQRERDASTLEVNQRVKDAIPIALDRLPKEARGKVHVKVLFDQSVFVRASINGVLDEAALAAGLTALMILMFLGSWRSTLTVVISIPLSILFSISMLKIFGYTLNVMTLGGLALAATILAGTFWIFGFPFLTLHYRIARKPAD